MANNEGMHPLAYIFGFIGLVVGVTLNVMGIIGFFMTAIIIFGTGLAGGIIGVLLEKLSQEIKQARNEKKLKPADYVKAFIPTIISISITIILALCEWTDLIGLAVCVIILCCGISTLRINKIRGNSVFSGITTAIGVVIISIAVISCLITIPNMIGGAPGSGCTICGKSTSHTFQGSNYCTTHYNDAVKWAIDNSN